MRQRLLWLYFRVSTTRSTVNLQQQQQKHEKNNNNKNNVTDSVSMYRRFTLLFLNLTWLYDYTIYKKSTRIHTHTHTHTHTRFILVT